MGIEETAKMIRTMAIDGATATQAGRRAAAVALLAVLLLGAPVRASAAESRQYDALGRLTDVAYANGGLLHYTYDANGNVLSVVTSLAATAVDATGARFDFALGPVLPNPGSGARNIAFSIPERARVSLRVFDVSGRQVATLLDAQLPAGRHSLSFSTDRWGNGVYFYRLAMPGRERSGRLVVLR
jgi:YD repeat-containing protein